MCSGQGQSKRQCFGSRAPSPPTVSLKSHSLGSDACLPFPPSPVQEQECPQVSSPDPLPSSLGNNHPLQQQGCCILPGHLLPGIRARQYCPGTSRASSAGITAVMANAIGSHAGGVEWGWGLPITAPWKEVSRDFCLRSIFLEIWQ